MELPKDREVLETINAMMQTTPEKKAIIHEFASRMAQQYPKRGLRLVVSNHPSPPASVGT